MQVPQRADKEQIVQKTQVWLGDLRVVALVWLLVLCFASIDLLMSRTVRPCTDVFTAYSHVRTEPLVRHRPNSRKKKEQIVQRCQSNNMTVKHTGSFVLQSAKAVIRIGV